MNKDTVLASTIGFGLGLVVAIALWIIPRFVTTSPSTSPSPTQTTQSEEQTELLIKKPIDKEMVTNKKITIEGTSGRGIVVVGSPLEETVSKLDAPGSFQTNVSLEEGENEITITSYLPTGEVNQTKTITIMYNHQDL